jgi:precorrin-6B methylase 2
VAHVSAPLDRCLTDPGYTPPVSSIAGLLAALEHVDGEQEKALRRAVERAGRAALAPALAALPAASPLLRERLLALLAAFAERENQSSVQAADESASDIRDTLLPPLLAALSDAAPRCRRAAARALGKLGDARAEGPLLATLNDSELAEQRAALDALGKLGGERAREALAGFQSADTDVMRRAQNARALIERRATRDRERSLVFDRSLPGAFRVVARCRSGLGGVLRDEASAFRVLGSDDARVEFEHHGSLGDLLALRTALDFGVLVPLDQAIADPAERIAQALESETASGVLSAWSSGVPTVRLEFGSGGHRRALSWSIARRLLTSGKVANDPRAAAFTAEVPDDTGTELLLVPRLSPDPRFAYRVKDVPAASHPTLAAALARLAGVRADDVIWDPFVGSGLELIERARLGPYARLIGSDLLPSALEATRANAAAAKVERLELRQGDARTFSPSGVRLIVTNPPMGRRVARDGSLPGLLEQFIVHAARTLVPGGRLVWLSPLERHTARVGIENGLSLETGPDVDLGGFRARIQAFERKRARRS